MQVKWTYDWLKDYLETDATPQQVADMLTRIGLEIEGLECPVVPIAAKIVECEDIPGTHLHLLKVDDGTDILRQVVCGAPNARGGLVSALALPGCKIPLRQGSGGQVDYMEIKSGKIRGVISDGMMCSEKEIGIGEDDAGIMELDPNIQPGAQISNFKSQISNVVFDAGITPNRPDYLAVRGIARDLSATGIGKYKDEFDYGWFGELPAGKREAVIKNYAACPSYYLCEINDIKIAPSNPKIAGRLSAVGINPRNAPIDATNYVCYDLGQPLHCFDADEIKGDIIIRNAETGEKFTDLFGAEHELIDTDLVIADQSGILALAGVVGGSRGMTTDKTKNIILESAYFSPVGIRKTAKRLGLSTDASYRYERGIDPTIAMQGISAAAKIIRDACGGEVQSPYRDIDKDNPAVSFWDKLEPRNYSQNELAFLSDPRRIEYSPDLFKIKTGIDLAPEEQKEILEKLGFGIEISQISNLKSQIWHIAPTPARVDVVIPENIVSELIRIYGYEHVGLGARGNVPSAQCPVPSAVDGVKRHLTLRGLNEIMSYKFGDSQKEKLLSDRPQIRILNPIINTFDTVRNGLVQNTLDIIANNDRYRRSNLNLFEIGTVFDGNQPGQQHDQLIIARTGIYGDKIGIKHGREVSIYDIREDLLSLFPGAAVENGFDDEGHGRAGDEGVGGWAHPFRAGCIFVEDASACPPEPRRRRVAQFAELHPAIAKKFGIKTKVVLGIVDDISLLPEQRANFKFQISNFKSQNDFPDFPLITRDFAFIVDNDVSPEDIVAGIAANNATVYETNVFDVFDLGDSKKSVALEVVIQPESNMSDADLLDLQNKIIEETEKKFAAKIRDK